MRNGRWLSVLYVTRVLNGSDRRTIYEPAIEYARKEIGSIGISPVDISAMSAEEMVEKLRGTDIVLATSGSGLSICVLLLPNSGVVEVMPENYRSSLYQKMAGDFSLYYLAHTNFTGDTWNHGECAYTEEMEDIRELPKTCRENLEKGEVYVHPITLWMMLVDMSKAVSHNKYNV